MNKTLTQAIAILALFTAISLQAQVTIGSDQTPNKGALLDLTQGSSTNKGLGLPRVKLNSLSTPGNDLKVTVDGATGTAWDKDEHIGLLVYNTNKVETASNRVCPGVHIWDGDTWQPLVPYADIQEQKTFLSVSNRNFEYLDSTSPASAWPSGKTAADFPLGYIGTFTDTRPGDGTQTYHHTRFYVGYKTWIATYEVERSYNCDPGAAPSYLPAGTKTEPLSTFEDGVWMTQNLRAIRMPDGTAIAGSSAASNTTPYYHYPNLQSANRATLGVVYNWAAAVNIGDGTNGTTPYPDENVQQGGSSNDDVYIQGICPQGWHLPAEQEWTDLENGIILKTATFSTTADIGGTLLSYDATGYRGTSHGAAMKTTTSVNAKSPNGTSKAAAQGGFDGYLTGIIMYNYSNSVFAYGAATWYWSASINGVSAYTIGAWHRNLDSSGGGMERAGTSSGNAGLSYLYPVRCKKG